MISINPALGGFVIGRGLGSAIQGSQPYPGHVSPPLCPKKPGFRAVGFKMTLISGIDLLAWLGNSKVDYGQSW